MIRWKLPLSIVALSRRFGDNSLSLIVVDTDDDDGNSSFKFYGYLFSGIVVLQCVFNSRSYR